MILVETLIFSVHLNVASLVETLIFGCLSESIPFM